MVAGFTGPRQEAEAIKRQVGTFLHEHLKLELSETKTLITHARTGAARFLGYDIVTLQHDQKHDWRQRRSLNAHIGLHVPREVLRDKCARYRHHGKIIHRMELTHDSPFSIVAQYQAEYRGLVAYYQMADNVSQLNRLKWHMERSLVQTLARKLRVSVNQVYHRYRATLQTDRGTSCRPPGHGCARRQSTTPLVATWGGVSLARRRRASSMTRPCTSRSRAANSASSPGPDLRAVRRTGANPRCTTACKHSRTFDMKDRPLGLSGSA